MSRREWIAKAEVIWWMSRTYTDAMPLVLTSAAWLAASGGAPEWPRHLLLLAAVVPFAGAGMVLNDVRDRHKDRTTAPFMPLPAGLISPPGARRVVVGMIVAAVALIWLAAPSAIHFLGASGALVATVSSAFVYSALKPIGIAASAFIGLPYVGAVAVATITQGGAPTADTWLIALFAWVYGCHSNIGTAMFDMDLDRRVGNLTVPVRLGGRRAWVLLLAGEAIAWVLTLAVIRGHDAGLTAYALWWTSVAIAIVTLPRMRRTTGMPRARLERIDDLAPLLWIDLVKTSAVVAVFVPWLGIVYAVATIALNTVGEAQFRRRIVDGGIACERTLYARDRTAPHATA
jgi:4-hydroxybenzoate polyprenyltransferase